MKQTDCGEQDVVQNFLEDNEDALGIFPGLVQMVALVPLQEFFYICSQEKFDSCLLSPIIPNVCVCVCVCARARA
jgi:hypothetical protein